MYSYQQSISLLLKQPPLTRTRTIISQQTAGTHMRSERSVHATSNWNDNEISAWDRRENLWLSGDLFSASEIVSLQIWGETNKLVFSQLALQGGGSGVPPPQLQLRHCDGSDCSSSPRLIFWGVGVDNTDTRHSHSSFSPFSCPDLPDGCK